MMSLAIQEEEFSIGEISHRIRCIEVLDDETSQEMGWMYKRARAALKALELEEMMELDPFKEKMNLIKMKFSSSKASILLDIDICKDKMTSYQKILEEKKRKEDIDTLDLANILGLTVYVDDKAVKAQTASTTTYTRKTKKYRIVDESLIPREFLEVNEGAIKLAMKIDKHIPGIEYYTEENVNLRLK